MKTTLLFLVSLVALNGNTQTDSTKSKITFSGFLETYYSYDMSMPANHTKSGFIYSHNRANEFNLNLGYLKANFEKSNLRANFALMTGTYSNANLAAEPGVLKNIYESNAGVKISKKHDLWIDAGVFASHIGFESAYSPSCWTLTRSILADNSPYYECGAKISFTNKNKKWFLSGLLLNGWQRIQRVNGNSAIGLGHQITYKPNDKITFNSSSFVGSDSPDSVRCMRYFHNFYGQFQLHEKVGLILGFDNGMQQKSKGSSDYNIWFSPVLIAKFSTSTKTAVALRGEYYSDKNQVMISTGTLNGFQTVGYSVNFDFIINEYAVWRIEAKGYNSKDTIFQKGSEFRNQNYYFTTSLALTF